MAINGGMFTSINECYCTPQRVIDIVINMWGYIALDPASNENSIVPADIKYDLKDGHDGLVMRWEQHTYCNPPYGREIIKWVRKAFDEWVLGCESILLLPSRTDTKWIHLCFNNASAICFLKGRLTFLGAPSAAPFPSCLIYFGKNVDKFAAVCSNEGYVVDLRGEY